MARFSNATPVLFAALIVGCPTVNADERVKLPIFEVGRPIRPSATVQRLTSELIARAAGGDKKAAKRASGARLRTHVNFASGEIWLADESRLWNIDLVRKLPTLAEAKEIGSSVFKKHKIPPPIKKEHGRWEFHTYRGTRMSTYDSRLPARKRVDCDLDVQYSAVAKIRVQIPGEKTRWVPICGGLGRYNLISRRSRQNRGV